jgi:diguanylate cyclase (GGDEF)-like protein
MESQEKSLNGGRGRILVVDDSVVVRALVGGCLRRAGFDVAEADTGKEALRLLEHEAFDVVITDLNMPEMGGLAMLAELRKKRLSPEVIILTGSRAGDVDSAVSALRLGAHDYLTKPPQSADAIIVTVERALEKKRLRDENARLVKDLQTLSLTDPLTGLPNRRAFDEALRHEKARARRHAQTLAVVMFDIDHFKRVNDTYGHGGGDVVLKHFATTLSRVLRSDDVLYRIGGEEFAALLPETTPTAALEAAARVLAVVAASPVQYEDAKVRITVSAGVACTKGLDDGKNVVAEADAALYAAKRGGRNRVFLPLTTPRAQASLAS